jgi:collagenase-like PrtC family protease
MPASDVKKYVKLVQERGWSFDFNVNSSCTANKELTVDGHKEVMKYLEWVSDMGIDAVTITNTNLIGIVKKHLPKMRVNLSTFQKVTEVAQARRFEDMGVDLIMLSEHVNRDFKALRAIRRAVKCQLALIANVGCIYDCPNMQTHANSIAHSGAKGEQMLFAESFALFCFGKRLESMDEVIKIRWIRPEDVSHYEDVGIDVLKILERNSTTEVLAERVKAYSERHFQGNLIRLLGQMIDAKASTNRAKELVIRRMFTRPGLKSLRTGQRARAFGGLFSNSLYDIVYLDNQKIPDDFIKGFMNRDCRNADCRTCGNCEATAKKAVHILDEGLLANTRQLVKQALENIRDGSLLY